MADSGTPQLTNVEYLKKAREIRRRARLAVTQDGNVEVVRKDAGDSRTHVVQASAAKRNRVVTEPNLSTPILSQVVTGAPELVPAVSEGVSDIPDDMDFTTDNIPFWTNPATVVDYEIEDEALYFTLLDHSPDVQILNSTLYILPLFDMNRRSLKSTFAVIVRVKESLLCSCSGALQQQQLYSENYRVDDGYQCTHLSYAERSIIHVHLMDWYANDRDDHSYIPTHYQLDECKVYGVNSRVVIVAAEGIFCTVNVSFGRLKCSCGERISSHTQAVERVLNRRNIPDDLGAFKENLRKGAEKIFVWDKSSYSKGPISYTLTRESMSYLDIVVEKCHKCGCSDNSPLFNVNRICYDLLSSCNVQVQTFSCSQCRFRYIAECDGQDYGVLNMGDELFTHELLRDHLKLYLLDGVTLYCYYRKMILSYIERKSIPPTYYQYRNAWNEFCRLIPTDLYYICPTCQDRPKIIICDGITLSFRKRSRIRTTLDEDACTTSTTLNGLKFVETLIIRNQDTRNQLNELLCDAIGMDDKLNKLREISVKVVFLTPVYQICKERDTIPCHWMVILKDLAKNSPAMGIQSAPEELESSMMEFFNSTGNRGDTLLKIQLISPSIHKFLMMGDHSDHMILYHHILPEFLKRLSYIHSFRAHNLTLQVERPTYTDEIAEFPHLAAINSRGNYKLDTVKHTNDCSKHGKQQKVLLPGIFLIHCEHAICYGFSLLDNHESPNTPFTIMRTRFKQAPDTIIYDNACNLHRYCLNRDPGFFSSTRFLVDRFHWNNHTGCAAGYNTDAYTSYKTLNTQVAEQRNSVIGRLRNSLSYMHQDNFVLYLKLFISFRNMLNVLKQRDPENEDEKNIRQFVDYC